MTKFDMNTRDSILFLSSNEEYPCDFKAVIAESLNKDHLMKPITVNVIKKDLGWTTASFILGSFYMTMDENGRGEIHLMDAGSQVGYEFKDTEEGWTFDGNEVRSIELI